MEEGPLLYGFTETRLKWMCMYKDLHKIKPANIAAQLGRGPWNPTGRGRDSFLSEASPRSWPCPSRISISTHIQAELTWKEYCHYRGKKEEGGFDPNILYVSVKFSNNKNQRNLTNTMKMKRLTIAILSFSNKSANGIDRWLNGQECFLFMQMT